MFKSQSDSSVLSRVSLVNGSVLSAWAFMVTLVLSPNLWADYRLDDGERLKDPTAPAQYRPISKVTKQASTSFKLSYILDSEARRYAIINGKKLSIGDRVEGARLLEIRTRSVVLLVKGKRQTITMNTVKGIQKKN